MKLKRYLVPLLWCFLVQDPCFAAVLATDNFDRGNNTDLGASWDVQTGDGRFGIVSNAAAPWEIEGDCAENYNGVTWPADQYSQVKITVTGSDGGGPGIGVGLRMSSSARTYYRIVLDHGDTNNVEVARFVSGTFTSLGFITTTWANGDTLKASITGTGASRVIRVYINGIQIGSDIPDASGGIDSGRAGIAFSSFVTAASVDDWEGGSLGTAGSPINYYRQMSGQ